MNTFRNDGETLALMPLSVLFWGFFNCAVFRFGTADFSIDSSLSGMCLTLHFKDRKGCAENFNTKTPHSHQDGSDFQDRGDHSASFLAITLVHAYHSPHRPARNEQSLESIPIPARHFYP